MDPRHTTRTVWLVGMMGSGKTSVGERLAERLHRAFVDTDRVIEQEAGATVTEIFAREGEPGFRSRERAAVAAVAGTPAVVSLGGGAAAQPGMIELLTDSGVVVYLRARPETLLLRVADDDSRPLLSGLDGAARLEALRRLLAARREHYERAQIVVDTDEDDVESLSGQLVRRLAGATG